MSDFWEKMTTEELIESLRDTEREYLIEPVAEALARILPNALAPIYVADRSGEKQT